MSDYKSPLKTAICAFKQKGITIKKGTENPFYKSRYADLVTILEAVEKEAAECGLVIVSQLSCGEQSVLSTTLSHKDSDECYVSSFPVFGTKPQEIGSSISYARRYNIQSLLNLAADDDDGNEANKAKTPVFANAIARATFVRNVIDSFNQIDVMGDDAMESLTTLQQLNAEKLAAMKEGDDKDMNALNQVRDAYSKIKAAIEQAELTKEQLDKPVGAL